MNARQIVLPLLAAILCAVAPALAQNAEKSADPAPRQQEARASVTFPGGTVAEYTAAVRRAFPGANIAVAPGIEAVRLAPVELTSVNINEAIFAIPTLSESAVAVDWFGTTAMVNGAAATKNSGVERPPVLRVFALAQVLSEMQPDDALAAVQTALDLVGPGATVKFHADTQLLMVTGTPAHINAAEQVVQMLFETWSLRRDKQTVSAVERVEWALETSRSASSDAQHARDRVEHVLARVNQLREELQQRNVLPR